MAGIVFQVQDQSWQSAVILVTVNLPQKTLPRARLTAGALYVMWGGGREEVVKWGTVRERLLPEKRLCVMPSFDRPQPILSSLHAKSGPPPVLSIKFY